MKKQFFDIFCNKCWLVLLFILSCSFSVSSQTSLPEAEEKLSALFEEMRTARAKDEVLISHIGIGYELYASLKNPESFSYPFESLNFLGKIYSDDNLLRIYTWNVPFSDGTFTYGCIVQEKDGNKLTVFGARSAVYKPLQDKYIAVNNWYGALYYQAIPVTYKKTTYYVLLGWAGNDDLTTLKIIDVLTFDNKGKAQLGLPVFKNKNKSLMRVVFEYGKEYTMTLDYDKKKKQIVFDHLAPSDSKYEGIYTHYGPDFTYDAYQLKKADWILKEDVDVRNELY